MNPSQARVSDPVLTQIARDYRNASHVGHIIFPQVFVTTQGGKIVEFGKDAFRRHAARRAPGAQVAEIGFRYGSQPFQLINEALDSHIPREVLNDASEVPKIDLGKRAVKSTMDSLKLNLEFEIAEMATNPANYGAANVEALAGTDVWSDDASDPVQVIEDGKETVRRSCGVEPNRLVLSKPGFNALRFHPKIREQFKYTTADSITANMLAAYLELDTVAVGKTVAIPQDVADDDDVVMEDAWGNSAVLAYAPDNPAGVEEPSFGYTYTMEGHPFVEKPEWRGANRSWVYGTTYDRAPVIVGAEAGFLIQGVVG
ncbi:major capsid protein [Loktanella sp. 3ANDIMAR09]|uniref:major capsid protein n=1 Tax=Loktanella sp. 3ANDIMAR09 TaxID=1225657 RepID=UPI0006FE8DC7|nr:major capsid protein [Loktanella sp. 3ANDIMAR09]